MSSTAELLKEFLDTDIVRSWSINFIEEPRLGPLTYPTVLLIIAVIAFTILLLYYHSLEKSFSRRSAVKAYLLSFMIVGFLFALRMDLNWLAMFRHDIRTYRGKDIGARVVTLANHDLSYFADFVRANIPEGELAREIAIDIDRDRNSHLAFKKVKYYLLPTKTSISGRYLWANEFTSGSYNTAAQELSIHEFKFKAVPHARYNEYRLVFRIIEE
jgi:hypothetical protein